MRIVTERGYNIHIFPVVNRRGKKEEEYVIKNLFRVNKYSKWNYNCYRIMDFISTELRSKVEIEMNKIYGEIIIDPEHPFFQNLPYLINPKNKLNKQFLGLNNFYDFTIKRDIKQILNHPCIKGMSLNSLNKSLDMVNNFEFEVKGYSLYGYNDNKYDYSYKYSNWGKRSEKFVDINENFECVENKKNKKRKIIFKNTGIFSNILNHNVITRGYCDIKEPFYSLSKYANILYRHNFLSYPNRTTTLNSKTTSEFLGSSINEELHKNKINQRIEYLLNELQDNNLITILSKSKDLNKYYNFKVTNLLQK